MNERFEIERDGRAFCICEICLRGDEEYRVPFIEDLIAEAKAGIITYVGSFMPSDAEREAMSRFRVVPYRYRIFVTCSALCECLTFCELYSSFEARFPGGRRKSTQLGILCDVRTSRLLKPSFRIFPDISRKMKKGLGVPIGVSLNGEKIKLVCSLGEYCVGVTEFCKNYKRIADFGSKFDKKAIDK